MIANLVLYFSVLYELKIVKVSNAL